MGLVPTDVSSDKAHSDSEESDEFEDANDVTSVADGIDPKEQSLDSINDHTDNIDNSITEHMILDDSTTSVGSELGSSVPPTQCNEPTNDKDGSNCGRTASFSDSTQQSFEELRLSETIPSDVVIEGLLMDATPTTTSDIDGGPSDSTSSRSIVEDMTTPTHEVTHNEQVYNVDSTNTVDEDHTHSVTTSSDQNSTQTNSQEDSVVRDHTHSNESVTVSGIESFVMIDSSQILDTSSYEESGVFYGAGVDNRTIVPRGHTPTPPPESGDDALTSGEVTTEARIRRGSPSSQEHVDSSSDHRHFRGSSREHSREVGTIHTTVSSR